MNSALLGAAWVILVVLYALWRSRGRRSRHNELPAWQPGSVVLGDFVVERELGGGGMGVVHLVRSRTSGGRFAVKRGRLPDARQRQRQLLDELRTWMGLPEHPHVVRCHFFSTVGDEIVIFSELVGGGSLARWISERRLTTLESILDVAIQTAWGLHAIHELGLVHQDVKPSNILLSNDRAAKVTDFGIARGLAPGGGGITVSHRGMTPAYCSPEQAEGRTLDRRTDVWSFGLSVLEMFTGEVTWLSGVVAPEVLDAYSGSPRPDVPEMPREVMEILRRCFALDPADRWDSLNDAARALAETHARLVGRPYPRRRPPIVARPALPPDRRSLFDFDTEWQDPGPWLAEVLREMERDPEEAERLRRPTGVDPRGRLLSDLVTYEEIIGSLDARIVAGRRGLDEHVPALLMNKAIVHLRAGDATGAIATYDRTIALLDRLARGSDRTDLRDMLAAAHANRGAAQLEQGRVALAIADLREALRIRRDLHALTQDPRTKGTLGATCAATAGALRARGDHRESLEMLDEAIALYDDLTRRSDGARWRGDLASARANRAAALCEIDVAQAPLSLFDEAIEQLRREVERGRADLADEVTRAMTNKALALAERGHLDAALAIHDQVISERGRLLASGPTADAAASFAASHVHRASVAIRLGEPEAAMRSATEAVEVYQRLVGEEGRLALRGDLARATLVHAWALDEMGQRSDALVKARRALALLEEEVQRGGLVDDRRWMLWALRRFPLADAEEP